MKFLGIDTKVIGNDETISMTLNTLKLLEYETFFNQNISDIKVVIYDKN